jgi:pyruvate/2-oxoglutarate/acetoin dehydrogenase E1 component
VTPRNLNVSQCVAEAIQLEMRRDERVLVLGEDVAAMGGTFGATRNLLREFGEWRVRDTPIAEMTFTGMAVGLAMAGYRPVVEIMFVDFIGVCLEQIYNGAAKIPFMSGGTVEMPIVVKTAGGNIGSAAQHSQCLWGTLAHLPGMRVVVPSNPYDAKGLMATAVRSDDPVIYIEHKDLLLRRAGDFSHGTDVPADPYTIPLGRANVVRPGADITLVTIGASVAHALAAAEELAPAGLDVEIIDLRTLVPLDIDAVVGSVARTRRLLVVDEDYMSYGMSAEVLARVVEHLGPQAIERLERLALADVPVPAALSLEQAVMPGPESIASSLLGIAERF